MANNLYREYSVDYTPQATSGKMTVWSDTPVSPLNIGDTFSPVDGVNIQVNHVNISDEVIGTLFGRPVRQWKIEIEGDSSISTSIVYDFNNQNGIISGSMTVKNTGVAPVFTLNIGDTFTIPNVGTLTCYEISGSNDEEGTWTLIYEGTSSTSKTKYSYTEEINGTKTVSIEVSGRGTMPSPEYSVGDEYREYTIARISSSNDISTKEWTYTYEGEYPFRGITEQYTYSEEYDYGNSPTSGDITVVKTATGERSGSGSTATPIWEIGATTSIGRRGNYVITSHEIRYTPEGWTETCTGQDPAPTKTGVGYTERVVTFSEEIENGETVTKVNIEVSGKANTQPEQPTGITGYTLTSRSVNYNENTKEYTTVWEGQNPAPDVVGSTETKYVFSEDDNGVKQVTKTITGKSSSRPAQPSGVDGYILTSRSVDYNENTHEYTTTWEGQDVVPDEASVETSYSFSESVEDGIQRVTKTVSGKASTKPAMPTEGVTSYFLVNRSVDYNETTKEYTTTWEGQIPEPEEAGVETTITVSEADGIEKYTVEVTGKNDTQPIYPSDVPGYTRTSRSVNYNQNTKEYTTTWEGQNPAPEETGDTETRYTLSEEIDGVSTIKHVTKVVTGKSDTRPEQPSEVTGYTLTSRSVDYNETTKEYTTTWEGRNPAPASETATETKITVSEDEDGIKKYTKEITGYNSTPPSLPTETTNTYDGIIYSLTNRNVIYNETTHEYTITWEGQYPKNTNVTETKITLNSSNDDGIEKITYEISGIANEAPSLPAETTKNYNGTVYYYTNAGVSYNQTTKEYTTTWEGQNPKPEEAGVETKISLSEDDEIKKITYEVSGVADEAPAIPSDETKTYSDIVYYRTNSGMSYNAKSKEYTTTWEGQNPEPTGEVTEYRISLSEDASSGTKKLSYEVSGTSSTRPAMPNDETKTIDEVVYYKTNSTLNYNETTKEYTSVWEGEYPQPTSVGGTETKINISEEEGIMRYTREVSGKNDEAPSLPSEATITYGGIEYTRTGRGTSYNTDTNEYTTTWEGQYPAPENGADTETKITLSEDEKGNKKLTYEISGKSTEDPSLPSDENKTYGGITYYITGRSINYNKTSYEYTSIWEGQNPKPDEESTAETVVTASVETDGTKKLVWEVTGFSDEDVAVPTNEEKTYKNIVYYYASASVKYNRTDKSYTTTWEGQNPKPTDAQGETRVTLSEEKENGNTIKKISYEVSGTSSNPVDAPSDNTRTYNEVTYSVTSRSSSYNETTKEYTTTWEGQYPAPDDSSRTVTSINLSKDKDGVMIYTYEVSGSSNSDVDIPDDATKTYDDIVYTRSNSSVSYNRTSKEYTTTWEGQYPATSTSSESKITLNETVENNETIKTISYEETGTKSSAPNVPSDTEREYKNVTYYLINRGVVYNETTKEYTTTWEGQNPNPSTGSTTETKVTVSIDENDVKTLSYEVSGKANTSPALPSGETKEYLGTTYYRTRGAVAYNETTKEYTTTWEGQYPKSEDSSETETRISLSQEIDGYDTNGNPKWIMKFSKEISGKSNTSPTMPSAETDSYGGVTYYRMNVGVVYNETTKEYTTTWEGQNPKPSPEDEGANETNRTTYTDELDSGIKNGYKAHRVTIERGGTGTMPSISYSIGNPFTMGVTDYICTSLDKVTDEIEHTWSWTAEGVHYDGEFNIERSKTTETKTSLDSNGIVIHSYSEEESGVGTAPSPLEAGNDYNGKKITSAGVRTEIDENGKTTWTIYFEADDSPSSSNTTKKETCTIHKESNDIKSFVYTLETTDTSYSNYSVGDSLSTCWGNGKVTKVYKERTTNGTNTADVYTIEAHYNEPSSTPSLPTDWEETNRSIEVNGVTTRSVKGNLVVVKREVGTITKATYSRYTSSATAEVTIGNTFGGTGTLSNAIVMSERITKETTTINEVEEVRYRHDVEVEI